MSKLITWLSIFVIFITQVHGQQAIMFDKLTEGFYASVWTSDTHFYATTETNGQEFVYEFTLVDNSWQKKIFWEDELATGGKIGDCPYFYSRENQDLFPLDDKFPEFSTSSDEVWVTGNNEIIYIIADYDNPGNLDIYEILYEDNWDDPTLNEYLSNVEVDEHGIFLKGDSIFFSRFEENKWQLYYANKKKYNIWNNPKKKNMLYNSLEGTIYYSIENGNEYFSMKDAGKKGIYTIEEALFKTHQNGYTLYDLSDVVEVTVDENGVLKMRLRDGTRYEISVTPSGVGFYNHNVDLVEGMHVFEDESGNIVTLSVDEDKVTIKVANEFSCQTQNWGRSENNFNKDDLNSNSSYLAVSASDTLLLVQDALNSTHIAFRKCKKNSDSNQDYTENNKIDDDTYVSDSTKIVEVDGEFFAVPNTSRTISNLSEIENKTFSEEELVEIFGFMGYTTVYTQVGLFYSNRKDYFSKLLNVPIKTMRMVYLGKSALRHYVPSNDLEKSLVNLYDATDKLKNDIPFIYIGRGSMGFEVVTVTNGEYRVKRYPKK